MVKARDIIDLAFFDAGVFGTGQVAPEPDFNKGLTRLNEMIYQWRRQRWLVYVLSDKSVVCTGATSYTIGDDVAASINTPRPDKIEYAYIRQISPAAPNQVDTPLTLVLAREDFASIVQKQLSAFPRDLFYESSYPLGRLWPWPLPSSLYELHVIIKEQLQSFPLLTTNFNMPEEYLAALRWNLAKVFQIVYKMPADKRVENEAKVSLNIIRNTNFQMPVLRVPSELTRPGLYNVFSDQSG